METYDKVLKKYARIVTSDTLPPPRFGHTVNLVSKNTIVVFGGAISTPGNYTMTSDLYIYRIQLNQWKKLETSQIGNFPHARAAHASAVVRENQLLFYGGSIGNGQYAQDDLWFLDIKNDEDASWMKVPIEGPTPGPRYGHSMVYIMPLLVLFGGSSGANSTQRNEVKNDIWVFGTDVTPFKWQRIQERGPSPCARLYHSACVYVRYNSNSDAMILFGGRDAQNASLKDLSILKKEKNDYEWIQISPASNEVLPIARHQQCSTIFGPFLIVVGGRASPVQATFDVFSFVSKRWFRFGTIGLFRHSIWVYFNAPSLENVDLYLYIYGGFDSENNSQINSNLYRINLIELFTKYDILKNELVDHIKTLLKKSHNNKHSSQSNTEENNRNHFELNNRVVVYNIPEENNFGSIIKEISYSKLTEVDKKIGDKPNEIPSSKKKSEYDEDNLKEFLQLLPNPDEDFFPLTIKDQPIILNKDFISKLIFDCKSQLMKGPSFIKVRSPVKIYGSINGQFNDLMRYFSLFGRPSEYKGDIESMDYLFLGNIVNRGSFSLECFCLLIALKVKHSSAFHILRGSQDDLEISKLYGLGEECKMKLGENINDSKSIFRRICDLFEYLPLAAVINNQILCVHSGIGEHVKTLNDLNVKRPCNLFNSPVAQEVLWSTPTGNISKEDYSGNNITNTLRTRHFDENMVKEFLAKNKLKMIIRSHDISEQGIEKLFNDKVLSIFSATNYCGYQNNGAILIIKKNFEIQPKILTYEDNYSVWLKDNWGRTDCPPSPKRQYKK